MSNSAQRNLCITSLWLIVFTVTNLLPFLNIVYAQEAPFSVVSQYTAASTTLENADIVITTEKGVTTTNVPYDTLIFGAIVDQPGVVFKLDNPGNVKSVARSGVANVKVTTVNGSIKTGDFITSSEIAGYGMRITTTGQVIGTALAPFDGAGSPQIDYTPKNPTKTDVARKVSTGTIPVAIRVEYRDVFQGKTSGFLNVTGVRLSSIFGNIAPPEKFTDAVKYILAAIIAIAAFAVGFFTFAKSLPKGVEALGRNPLAQASIQFSIVMQIVFTIGITLIGIIAAILIIRL